MTLRVVLLTTNLAPGGAESQVALLARGLRRRGWDVSVISLLRPTAFERELVSAGVPVFCLEMRPGLPDPLAFARLVAILRRLRPQIVHGHMFHANILARAVRLLCPVPVVISTAHSIVESSRRSAQARHREWLYRLTSPLADATVAVCQAGADRYAAIKAAPLSRLHVIPNGVDTGVFRPDPETRAQVRARLGIGPAFAWLAVGRLMWKKDYPALLHAFAGERDALLLIAGAGPLESELRTLAGRLRANVRFLGLRDDIPALMNACDGFVLSSIVEGLPMVLLEAASCAVPCVATDVGGVREIVLHERTGYVVPPGDPAALAGAISRLERLPADARERMGRAAREHAIARFDLTAVINRWEQLYLELLESATPRSPAPL